MVDISSLVATRQQTQTGLCVFGDAPFIPAANGAQGIGANQPHRSTKNDGVSLVAAGHTDIEEIAIGMIAGALIECAVAPVVAVVLRSLDKSDLRISEIAHQI